MAGGTPNTETFIPTIDALLGNFRWNSPFLTYNFPIDPAYYGAPEDYFGPLAPGESYPADLSTVAPVLPSLQTAITKAITTELMAVAPLQFTLVAAGRGRRFKLRAWPPLRSIRTRLSGRPASASIPASCSAAATPSSSQRGRRFNDVDVGDSAYWVVLHELGHTVGLKHGARQ